MSHHFNGSNATSALGNAVVEPGGMIDGKRPKLDVVRAMLSPIQSSICIMKERAIYITVCIALSASEF
jgi:hypothetical protein